MVVALCKSAIHDIPSNKFFAGSFCLKNLESYVYMELVLLRRQRCAASCGSSEAMRPLIVIKITC